MKLFNIGIQLGRDTNLTKPEEELRLIAKIKEWEDNALTDDATKFQKMYHKIHQSPLLEVLSPFIYVLIRGWFNSILNPPEDEEYDRYRRLDN
jgi:hypothetical protein